MMEEGTAWQKVNEAEWYALKVKGENVSWIEGAGLVVYDQQALREFQEKSEAIRRMRAHIQPQQPTPKGG